VGAVAATVLLSIFAHGVSALPGINWYARQVENLDESAPELQEIVSVLPGRGTYYPKCSRYSIKIRCIEVNFASEKILSHQGLFSFLLSK
jgi:hypothetical protein